MSAIRGLLIMVLMAPALAQAGEQAPTKPADAAGTYLVIYNPGPAWPEGKAVADLDLREHGRWLLGLYKQGVMTSAGPFTDNSGGAVVLLAPDQVRAEEIVRSDPAVEQRVFVYELRPWAPVDWQKFVKPGKPKVEDK